MTEAIEVTFTPMTELDKPDRGFCQPCALPSLLTWLFAVEANGNLFDGKLTTLAICTECGVESWEA